MPALHAAVEKVSAALPRLPTTCVLSTALFLIGCGGNAEDYPNEQASPPNCQANPNACK